jgi:hypothetical protein
VKREGDVPEPEERFRLESEEGTSVECVSDGFGDRPGEDHGGVEGVAVGLECGSASA